VAALIDGGEHLIVALLRMASDTRATRRRPLTLLHLDFYLLERRAPRPQRGAELAQAFAPTHPLHPAPRARKANTQRRRVHPAEAGARLLSRQFDNRCLRLPALFRSAGGLRR
jgi:hypothetical protein